MKSKTKCLFIFVIAVTFLLGTSYLFLAQQAQTEKSKTFPVSIGAYQTTPKPIVVNSPTSPPTEPAKSVSPAITKPGTVKEPMHIESEVPLYEGPTKATGDDCSDPIVVNIPGDLDYSDLGQTTCGRMNDYEDAAQGTCLYYYDGGEDIIYELSVSSAVDVDITMDPLGATWTGIAIDTECPPDAACIAYSYGSSSAPRVLAGVHLEPGTYYIMIDSWPSPDCFAFNLTITPAAGPPPNDNCADAEAVGDVVDLAWSTTNATTDGGGTCTDGANIWYCYTATCTGNVTVSLCGSSFDTKLAVYEGCTCDPLGTEIECNDDYCGAQSQITFAATAGSQYLIEVGGYSTYTGDGILNISCYVPGEPPENDECTGAPIINTFPTTVYGTTIDATIDCPGVLDWTAVWYQFDLPYENNQLLVDFCPTDGSIDTVGVVVYNECPADCPNYILYSGYQWVSCTSGYSNPQIWWNLPGPASYWFPVYVTPGKGQMDFGLEVSVTEITGPANDNCADAEPIGDVTDQAFSTSGATFDGPGGCMTSPNIWYCYTATCDGNVNVDLCGSTYDTKLAAYEGCSCDPVGAMLACNDDYCGVQSAISFSAVAGNQYLIEVGGYSTASGNGDITISCAIGPDNDECTGAPIINTFPAEVYGTTIGAGIDCPGVLDWNAVWYQFDVPYAANDITVDFCLTESDIYTVGVVLYAECPPDCPNYILYSSAAFVECPNGTTNPQIVWEGLPAGSYWFPAYVVPYKDSKQMDFGFEVSVEEGVPCVVTCPEGGRPEQEPICEDDWEDIWNGGCNSDPFVFENVDCGWVICGTSGTYDYYGSQYRDTDWFRVLAGDGDLTFKCVAEFDLQTVLFKANSEDCVDYEVLDYRQVGDCDTATITWTVTGGVYWLWVGPSVFSGVPCGAEYVMWVECTPFGPQISVDPSSFEHILNPDQTFDDEMLITNNGGEDLNYDITESPAASWLSCSPTSNTVSPGVTDPVTVSFDASGMTPGVYNTELVITSNALNDPEVHVPVQLTVELPPDIDVASPMSVGVLPGCAMDKALRLNNLGLGELRYKIKVSATPPPLSIGKSKVHEALRDLQQAGRVNPTIVPNEAYKVIGAERPEVNYISTGLSEGLLLLASEGKVADILLVDDDGGTPGGTYYDIEGIYMDALDAGGYSYDYYNVDWTDPLSDGPDLSTMEQYQAVVWFCGETWGYYGEDVLTANDEDNLGLYLDGGGNLFLSAQDWLWASYPSAGSFAAGTFPYDYLHLASVSQDVLNDPYTCTGLAGSVAEGMEFQTLRFTDNPDVPLWTDYLTTQSSAAVDVFDADGGISAVQYNPAKGYKVVFTTTEFAGLVDASPSTRAELMASIMDWFLESACPFTVNPEEGDVPAESFFDVVLTFDGTLFPECAEDVSTCYLTISSNDPDEPVVSVQVDMWPGRGDVVSPFCWIDVGDLVFLVNYVLRSGPEPTPWCMGDCDPTHDGVIDLADVVYLVQYLFEGALPPMTAPQMHQPANMR